MDKSLISLCIAGTLIFILFTLLLIFFTIYYRRSLNQHYLEKERLLSDKLEEGERMMNQIAKEVHDNIGQLSNFLGMTLKRLQKYCNDDNARQLLTSANSLTDLIISHSNNISHSLNSNFIKERGFTNVLQDDIEHLRNSGKLNCNLQISGQVNDTHPDKDLVIYRIAQEVIHNILKHSGATEVDISIVYSGSSFQLNISDNGNGFDPANMNGRGIGLYNMQDRAKLLNGVLKITSRPGEGCHVNLLIPDF